MALLHHLLHYLRGLFQSFWYYGISCISTLSWYSRILPSRLASGCFNVFFLFFRAQKLLKIRLWDDDKGRRWANSVTDMDMDVLCVSQFTIYHTMKGNKPDFRNAMASDKSEVFYNSFLERLRQLYKPDHIKGTVTLEIDVVNVYVMYVNMVFRFPVVFFFLRIYSFFVEKTFK